MLGWLFGGLLSAASDKIANFDVGVALVATTSGRVEGNHEGCPYDCNLFVGSST